MIALMLWRNLYFGSEQLLGNSWCELTHFNRNQTRNPCYCIIMTSKTSFRYACVFAPIPHSQQFSGTKENWHGC